MTKQVPPLQVRERFLPQEKPSFRLLRSMGPCQLWRSQTVEHKLHGRSCRPRVHYHVTTGEQADYLLVPVFRMALLDLFLAVQEAGAACKLAKVKS
ncbi:hypothetical protein ABIC89_000843 [Variovorax boronicumulans]|uniref:hypothetical protein n=1 Tax=Variovorax boronicumulans TaxID=436515 RepID=UPI00339ABDA8